MDGVTILGIQRAEKDGKVNSNIFYSEPFEDWQKEGSACFGFRTGSEFTRLDTSNLVVGDVVEFAYKRGFQGKAVLSGFTVIKPYKQPASASK